MKKLLSCLLVVAVLSLYVSTLALAEGVDRSSMVVSQGVVNFTNDDGSSVSIDSNDLRTLASEIDNLETSVKGAIATSLVKVGTTSGSKNMKFSELMSLIEHSQDVPSNTGAIANNLSAGKKAWVEGTLITGNGADVEDAYRRGYTEGQSSIQPPNASISVTYHSHTGVETAYGGCHVVGYHEHTSTCPYHVHSAGCYTQQWVGVPHSQGSKNCGHDRGGTGHIVDYDYSCSRCGACMGDHAGEECYRELQNVLTCNIAAGYSCGSPVNRWRIGCGKNETTIESMQIVYD